MRHIFSTLRATLNYAVDQRHYIAAHCVTEKNDRVKEMVAAPAYMQVHASDRELRAFVAEAVACRCAICVSMLVGFSLMMRKAEILGMRWQNLKEGKFIVREQLRRLRVKDRPAIASDGFVVVEKVKWGSQDILDLDAHLIALLEVRRTEQQQHRAKALRDGAWRKKLVTAPKGRMASLRGDDDNDLILTDAHGEPLDGKVFSRHYNEICRRAGITASGRGIRGVRVHDFRGSVAEMLLTTGQRSPRAVMTRGRWKSPQILMQYTNIQERHVADVGNITGQLLFGTGPATPANDAPSALVRPRRSARQARDVRRLAMGRAS